MTNSQQYRHINTLQSNNNSLIKLHPIQPYKPQKMFKFQQCSFIVVDFNKNRTKSCSTMFALESTYPLEFTDCTFMGVRKEDIGEGKKPVKYDIFSDLPVGHSLKLENCFFRNMESVYRNSQPPHKLEIINCSFEGMVHPCLQISNPNFLLISGNNFFNVNQYCIELIVDCFFEEYHFGRSQDLSELKHKYTTIIRKNKFTTCENAILIHSQKLILQELPLEIYIFENEIVNQIKNGIIFENLLIKSLQILDNKISSSGFSGVIMINCHSSEASLFQNNNLFANMKIGLCIENSRLKIQNCKFSRSITGIWLNFGHYDQLMEQMDPFPAPGHAIKNKKLTFQNSTNSPNQGNKQIKNTPRNHECDIRNTGFFDITKYGIIIASNTGGKVNCQKCIFQQMQAGVCIKETCTGTISKKVVAKNSAKLAGVGADTLRQKQVEDQIQTTGTTHRGGHDKIANRIGLRGGSSKEDSYNEGNSSYIKSQSKKGDIYLQQNQYVNCNQQVKQKIVKSNLYIYE